MPKTVKTYNLAVNLLLILINPFPFTRCLWNTIRKHSLSLAYHPVHETLLCIDMFEISWNFRFLEMVLEAMAARLLVILLAV